MRLAYVGLCKRIAKHLLPPEHERISERVVEYPFVIKNISGLEKGRILDVGCYGSCLTTILAALGHEVHALDIRRFPIQYPMVKIIEGDILQTNYSSEFFDAVVAVSTIEHVGIKSNAYGIHHGDPDGDKRAIREMARVLKPGGKMVITVPYGRGRRKQWRVYNDHSLKGLLFELKIDAMEFFALRNERWVQVSENEANEIENDRAKNSCVVLAALTKVGENNDSS